MYPKFETLKQTLGSNKAKMFISLPPPPPDARLFVHVGKRTSGDEIKINVHDMYFPRSTVYEGLKIE